MAEDQPFVEEAKFQDIGALPVSKFKLGKIRTCWAWAEGTDSDAVEEEAEQEGNFQHRCPLHGHRRRALAALGARRPVAEKVLRMARAMRDMMDSMDR